MRPTRRFHRSLVLASVLVATVPALAACGSSSDDRRTAPSSSASSRSGAEAVRVDITVQDGKVTPNGTRVTVGVGSPVTLRIDADVAGELHVHSSPEQEIEYPAGSSTHRVTIDRPGIVDVEVHALEQVVVQLQVS